MSGRAKRSSSKSAQLRRASGGVAAAAGAAALPASASLPSLVAHAEQCMLSQDLRQACSAYQRALALAPTDCSLLDALGEVLISLDEAEGAVAAFTRSTELQPTGGYSKWMYLGQLSSGAAAAACYTRGLELLQQRVAQGSGGAAAGAAAEGGAAAAPAAAAAAAPEPQAQLQRRLSEAYCSLAELYMTDLCDEQDAEARCDSYSAAALSADEGNAEAHQVRGRLCLVLKRDDEARTHLARCCALIHAIEEEGEEEEEEEGDGEESGAAGGGGSSSSSSSAGMEGVTESPAAAQASTDNMPSFDFRLETARVCMEAELYPQASQLLNALLAEDDTNMEVWFMAGEAALLEGDAPYAVDVLATADAMISAALSVQGRTGGGKAACMQASAAASAVSCMDFTPEAVEALLNTPPSSLAEQQAMIRGLLSKAQEAAGAAAAAAAAAVGGGGGGGMEQ